MAVAVGVMTAMPARAQTATSPPQATPMKIELVSASLLSDVRTIAPGQPFWVAVELTMLSGWHLNWVNPGDAGLAPTVTWRLPAGFEASEIMWPYPSRFNLPELSIFGYEGRVLLLSRITPPQHLGVGQITISAAIDWLACREGCVPGKSNAALALNVGPTPGAVYEAWAQDIEKARAMLPVTSDQWHFSAAIEDGRLTISAIAPEGQSAELEGVTFFPLAEGIVEHAAAQRFSRAAGGFRLGIELVRMSTETPTRVQGVLVSPNGWGKIENKALAVDIPIDG